MGKLCQKDKFYFTVYKELNYSTLYFAQQISLNESSSPVQLSG